LINQGPDDAFSHTNDVKVRAKSYNSKTISYYLVHYIYDVSDSLRGGEV